MRRTVFFAVCVTLALGLTGCKPDIFAKKTQRADNPQARALMLVAEKLETEASALRIHWLCLSEEISFERVFSDDKSYRNGFDADKYRCHMFGALNPLRGAVTPDPAWLDKQGEGQPYFGQWYYSGAFDVPGLGLKDGSQFDRELIAFLPYVTDDICVSVNDAMGIEETPVLSGPFDWNAPFEGEFAGPEGYTLATDGALDKRMAGCFRENGQNVFYQVLLVR